MLNLLVDCLAVCLRIFLLVSHQCTARPALVNLLPAYTIGLAA